jgi:hypothetical protein
MSGVDKALTLVTAIAALLTVYFARAAFVEARELHREQRNWEIVTRLRYLIDVFDELNPPYTDKQWRRTQQRAQPLYESLVDADNLPWMDQFKNASIDEYSESLVEHVLQELTLAIVKRSLNPRLRGWRARRRNDIRFSRLRVWWFIRKQLRAALAAIRRK